MSEGLGSWVGPILGLGFGLYTLKMLNQLPYSARQDIDVLLSKSRREFDHFKVLVREENLNRARRLLQNANFKITFEAHLADGTRELTFEEKRK